MDDTRPCLIVTKQNNALHISALNDSAAKIGLEVGLPLANGRAICPDAQVFDADPVADAKLLEDVADWCDRFTPLVALDPPYGLLLDISGCAHLFGGEAIMLRTICHALQRQGFIVNASVAGTPACAQTLSRAGHNVVVATGNEARAVANLPVFALAADQSITSGLRRAGLKTIGDVAARKPHEITARFGASFTNLLQQTLGYSDAPISPRKPLPDFMVEKQFADPVVTDTVISVALSDLARRLAYAMGRHGKGARQLEASFFRTDGAVRILAVQAARPVTRSEMIDRLFRERLDAIADPLDPGFGFDLIRLSASHVEIVVQEQRDFDAHVRDNDDVASLIDRISARIGRRNIVVHLPCDTHIPERAERTASAQHHINAAMTANWPSPVAGEPPLRPLHLFDPPEQITAVATAPDGPPHRFVWRRVTHKAMRVEGPERIAMEWWRTSNATRTRDYFRVENEEGLRFWIYREGLYGSELTDKSSDSVEPKWFIHGMFA